MTRRKVLGLAGGGAAAAALAGGAAGYAIHRPPASSPAPAAPDPLQRFVTRPDLDLPVVTITTPASGAAPGLVFLTPGSGLGHRGPMIVDSAGRPVWVHRLTIPGRVAVDAKVQRYRGRPVLTWWEGSIAPNIGVGAGEFVLMDTAYRELARVHAVGDTPADQHDFVLTPQGTALFFVYRPTTFDLRPIGGPARGTVYDGVIQEVDVATGRRVFEWRALDHVALTESFAPVTAGQPYDYFHANSIDVDTDGHLLVSGRHTSTIYKIHRRTGAVLWRLGGRKPDFTPGDGAAFSYQHDARRRTDGTLGLFDNAAGLTDNGTRSRGLVLRLDEKARTTTKVRDFPYPDTVVLARTQGSLQELPDGGAFVGFGERPYFAEYNADGTPRFAGHLPADNASYRAYRLPWTALPTDRPLIAARRVDGAPRAYVSWNGATALSRWRLRAGDRPESLTTAAEVPWSGWETTVPLPDTARFAAADALDATGETLASSPLALVPSATPAPTTSPTGGRR